MFSINKVSYLLLILVFVIAVVFIYTPSTLVIASGITEVGGGSQRATKQGTRGDLTTLAFPASPTAGNLLIVTGAAWVSGSDPSPIVVTDTRGTAYTVLVSSPTSNERTFIAYGIAVSSGADTVTVNPAGASSDFSFSIDEFSGVDSSSPLDIDGGISTGTSSSPTDSIITGVANALVVGVMTSDSSNTSLSVGTSYTQIGEEENNAASQAHNAEFEITASSGSHSVSWTTGASINWKAQTVSFKAVTGPPDTTAPSVPLSLSATTVSSSAINLSWSASTDSVGVTGYTIYRGGVQVGTTGTNNYNDNGLTASTAYTYKVDAFDAAGNHSSQSTNANATTQSGPAPDTTPPTTPANLSANAISSSAINLSWSASTDAVGVTGYKIFRNGSQIGSSASVNYTDTGLTASTNYSYTVSANDAAGNNSSQSASANATTQAQQANTINVSCSGDITNSLQNAINSASDGYTVSIAAGNCSAGTVSWTNKNIFVQGQGIGVTKVTGLSFNIIDTVKAAFRITGMSVGAAPSWKVNAIDRKTGIKGWRIDHVSWTYPSCGQNIAIWVDGINWGLMDHNQFMNAGNAIFRRAWADNTDEVNPWPPSGIPGMGGYSWLLPLNLGSDEALYMEDNSFVMDTGCYEGVGDSFYGGRSVFRHNTVVNAYWQNHATRGFERGGNLKAEIYNNDFNATDSAWSRAVHIRSGTGVVFNNSLRGYFNTMNVDNQRSDGQNSDGPFGACNGSSPWDGNTSGQAGWPCLDQIGRSSGTSYPNQTSAPLYIWNNGSSVGCSNGGSCANDITMTSDGDAHVQAGRDYINNGTTAKPGYVAFTYPYPLTANGLPNNTGSSNPPPTDITAPSIPSNLSATAISSSAISLSWTVSTDNVGVTGYKVFRNGSQIGTSVSTSYSDTGLTASTSYPYTVSAYDAAGNNSSQSSVVSSQTFSGVPVPGDFNSDHIVNSLDYSLLNSNWFKTVNISSYDLQVDGIINSFDYAILKSNWGKVW